MIQVAKMSNGELEVIYNGKRGCIIPKKSECTQENLQDALRDLEATIDVELEW